MAQVIDIPGHGEVEFPDGMSDKDITTAIRKIVTPPPSEMESIGRGAAQGATLGFGDELAGIGKAGLKLSPGQMLRVPTPKQFAKLYPGLPLEQAFAKWHQETQPEAAAAAAAEQDRQQQSDKYHAGRDEARQANDAARAAHPWLYGGGQVAGSLPLAFLGPAGAAGRALTLGRRMLAGAKAAIPAGAAFGLGTSNAEDLPGQAADTALGAGLSSLAGAGLPMLGAALRPVASKAKDLLSSLAETAAVRSAKATGAVLDKTLHGNADRASGLGRFLLDEGVPLRSPSAMKAGLGQILSGEGPQIGQLADQATAKGATFDLNAAAEKALNDPKVASLAGNAEQRPLYDRVKAFLQDQIDQHGPSIAPDKAHALRRTLDDLSGWDATTPKALSSAYRAVRGVMNDEMGATMEQAGLGEPWQQANARFSQAKLGEKLARSGVKKSGNELLSLPTYIASGAGAAVGAMHSPVEGLAIPLMTMAARKFGMPVTAKTADALASLIPKVAEADQSPVSATLGDFLRQRFGLQMTPAAAGAEEQRP